MPSYPPVGMPLLLCDPRVGISNQLIVGLSPGTVLELVGDSHAVLGLGPPIRLLLVPTWGLQLVL